MKLLRILAASLILLLSAACAPAPSQTLTVLAASSLTEPFQELGKKFEGDHPGVKVAFNFAGSQVLLQQLAQGVQADVFASASPKQMDGAVKAGRVQAGAAQQLARNGLVLVLPKDNPAGVDSLAGLARPGLSLALADPSVPAGQYALDFLANAEQSGQFPAGYRQAVLDNVVSYEENVKAVLTKVALGEVDAGIVYKTDAASQMAQILLIEIPEALNVTAVYPIAPLLDSPHPDLAQAFIDLALSPDGQALLARYGFLPNP